MELSSELIITILLGAGICYVFIYDRIRDRKFKDYQNYLNQKRASINREKFAKLITQEIAELTSDIKIRAARGQTEDPKLLESLEIVKREKEMLDANQS